MKNKYWNYRRFPTVDECKAALDECEKEKHFWDQMLPAAYALEGRRPEDEADFTNPVDPATVDPTGRAN